MRFFSKRYYTKNDMRDLVREKRKLFLKYHPDKGGNALAFAEMMDEFELIHQAIEVNGFYGSPTKWTFGKKFQKPKKIRIAGPFSFKQFFMNLPEWKYIVVWYAMFLASLSIGLLGGRYRLVAFLCVFGSMGYLYAKGKEAYGHWLTFFLLINTVGVLETGSFSAVNFVVILIAMPLVVMISTYLRSEE